MQQSVNLPETMTVKDLIRFLNISQPKAYELVNSKGFPAFRVGRNYRINTAKLLTMIESGHVF